MINSPYFCLIPGNVYRIKEIRVRPSIPSYLLDTSWANGYGTIVSRDLIPANLTKLEEELFE